MAVVARSAATSCSGCCGGNPRPVLRRAFSLLPHGAFCSSRFSATYLSYAQAAPVYAALGVPVPAAGEWPGTIAAADAATRARVVQGEEGSIVNLLLFGTSFTSQPRITSRQLNEEEIRKALDARLDDFVRALAQPGDNERLQYARRLLAGETAPRARLLSMIDRTMKEGEMLGRLTAEAQRLGDPSLEFAERSRLYRERGLARTHPSGSISPSNRPCGV